MFSHFFPLYGLLPNGLRYWLVGGTLTRSTGRKMFGTLKMLQKPHRTHKSSARFVGTLLTLE
jgi:hypothetical protein